jgi:hypothetical protein
MESESEKLKNSEIKNPVEQLNQRITDRNPFAALPAFAPQKNIAQNRNIIPWLDRRVAGRT